MSTTDTTTSYTEAFSPDSPITDLPESYSDRVADVDGDEDNSDEIPTEFADWSNRNYSNGDIDRQPGTGSIQSTAVVSDDDYPNPKSYDDWNKGRRTSFQYTDVDKQYRSYVLRYGKFYRKWKWLNDFDRGFRTSDWKGTQRDADQKYRLRIICSQLECSDHEKQCVEHWYDKISHQQGNYGHEEWILTLISFICNRDVTSYENRIQNHDMWPQLLDDLGTTQKRINNRREEYRGKYPKLVGDEE